MRENRDREPTHCGRWQMNNRRERRNPWGKRRRMPHAFCKRMRSREKGLRMRHQEMGKQNRLGMLHVRHARHGNLQIGFCLRQRRRESRATSAARISASGLDDEEAKIGGDKFVAAAAGVEFPAERAELLDQSFFDEMVHIFGGGRGQPGGIAFRRAAAILSSAASVCCTSVSVKMPAALQEPWPRRDRRRFRRAASGDRTRRSSGTRRKAHRALCRSGHPRAGHLCVRVIEIVGATFSI